MSVLTTTCCVLNVIGRVKEWQTCLNIVQPMTDFSLRRWLGTGYLFAPLQILHVSIGVQSERVQGAACGVPKPIHVGSEEKGSPPCSDVKMCKG